MLRGVRGAAIAVEDVQENFRNEVILQLLARRPCVAQPKDLMHRVLILAGLSSQDAH